MGMPLASGLDDGLDSEGAILLGSAHAASVGPKLIVLSQEAVRTVAERSEQNATEVHTKTCVLVPGTIDISILRKDARDLPGFMSDCQGQGQEQAGFLGVQVVGDQEAMLGKTGAFESPTTTGPRGLDYHDTTAHRFCERFQIARPTESGRKAGRHNPLRASLDEGTHCRAI